MEVVEAAPADVAAVVGLHLQRLRTQVEGETPTDPAGA
jgi:hypothetical protein